MDIQELKKYWLELSDYDLEAAHAMLDAKRYLYVGFMAHQSIEKALKAYFVFKEDFCRRLLNKTAEVQSWIKQMC